MHFYSRDTCFSREGVPWIVVPLYWCKELKQQWCEFALLQTLSRFIPSLSVLQLLAIFFWSWILKDWIKVQEKKNEVVVLCSHSPQNVEFWHFHDIVVQWQQRNVKKSLMHVQSCCFANLNPLLFWHSCRQRHHNFLSSLLIEENNYWSWLL